MTHPGTPLTRLRSSVPGSILGSTVVACLLAGCGVLTPEEQVLQRFFEASRLYDKAAVEKVATVIVNPLADGIVQEFAVTGVAASGDRRVVSVEAEVRRPPGTTREHLTVTMERRNDRWLIIGITRLPTSRISREGSSAPPS